MSDLDQVPPSPEADKGDGRPGKSPSVDYESKYKGEARRSERLSKELSVLQEKYDASLSQIADLEAKLRNSTKEISDRLVEVQNRAEQAEKNAVKLERDLKRLQNREETRKTLREKYPDLMEMYDLGDLREADEFEKLEDFQAYLERMAARLTPPEPASQQPAVQQRNLSGVTPQVNTRSRDGKKPRTVDEITEELWSLDPRHPTHRERYIQLQAELDEAQVASRR